MPAWWPLEQAVCEEAAFKSEERSGKGLVLTQINVELFFPLQIFSSFKVLNYGQRYFEVRPVV